MLTPQETYDLLSTKCQKYLKNLLNVSSSQFSWQSSSYPSANRASAFPYSRPYHWGTDHSGWSCDNRCTTRRLYKARHSLLCIYRYHDPWWKMTYHDDVDQVHHQQFLQKRGKANYRSIFLGILSQSFSTGQFHLCINNPSPLKLIQTGRSTSRVFKKN